MGKLAARRAARQYVADLISGQDTPDWAYNNGLTDAEISEFEKEIERIADRLRPAPTQKGGE